jgi:uncharacterized membrane protein
MKSTRSDWLIPAALVAFSVVPALGGAARMGQLVGGAAVTAENARFFHAPLPILLHIPFAVLYSMLGAFQFSAGLRRRYRRWHRLSGRVLIPTGFAVAVSGLWMTITYPFAPNDGAMVYAERLVFGTAMLLSLIFGVRAIVRRDFTAHGAWMTRAYAIGLGAGTQVFTHLPWFIFVNLKPGHLPRGIMMGAGWVINAIVAEWIVRRGKSPPARALVVAR